MTQVYCSECGFQNPESANYCSRCGALLQKGESATETTQTLSADEVAELGEHEDYVYGELLGMSSAERRALEDAEVIY